MATSDAAQHLRWTESHMPLMKDIAREFDETQPFRGIRIGVSLHLEGMGRSTGCWAVAPSPAPRE